MHQDKTTGNKNKRSYCCNALNVLTGLRSSDYSGKLIQIKKSTNKNLKNYANCQKLIVLAIFKPNYVYENLSQVKFFVDFQFKSTIIFECLKKSLKIARQKVEIFLEKKQTEHKYFVNFFKSLNN